MDLDASFYNYSNIVGVHIRTRPILKMVIDHASHWVSLNLFYRFL